MAKKAVKKQTKTSLKPRKSGAIPVTKKMLDETRAELKSNITTLTLATGAGFKENQSKFSQIDVRFDTIDVKFEQVDARFDRVDARFAQIDLRFDQVDARFAQIDLRFNQVDARFDRLEKRFDDFQTQFPLQLQRQLQEQLQTGFRAATLHLEAAIEKLTAEVHRIAVLVEEQNARNVFVLDGYASLDQRVSAIEGKIKEV